MKTILSCAIHVLTIVGALTFSPIIFANTFTGTIVVAKGDVKVLNSKIPNDSKNLKFVLFEGQKYSFDKAKIGFRLRSGQVVLTGTDGKAKISYANGDHLMIAPGTSVTVPAPNSQKKEESNIELFYGRMRALISKKGPRNNLKVKTKSAVAGVRGTDFFISHNHNQGMELVVLRGEVHVGDQHVKTGYHAKIKKTLETVEASKDKLLEVQAQSHIPLTQEDLKGVPEKQQKTVTALEEKATAAIIEDIRHHDPDHYEKIKNKKLDSHSIHTEVVAKLYKQAPAAKKPSKANLEHIDQMGKDVYEKYFEQ